MPRCGQSFSHCAHTAGLCTWPFAHWPVLALGCGAGIPMRCGAAFLLQAEGQRPRVQQLRERDLPCGRDAGGSLAWPGRVIWLLPLEHPPPPSPPPGVWGRHSGGGGGGGAQLMMVTQYLDMLKVQSTTLSDPSASTARMPVTTPAASLACVTCVHRRTSAPRTKHRRSSFLTRPAQ